MPHNITLDAKRRYSLVGGEGECAKKNNCKAAFQVTTDFSSIGMQAGSEASVLLLMYTDH